MWDRDAKTARKGGPDKAAVRPSRAAGGAARAGSERSSVLHSVERADLIDSDRSPTALEAAEPKLRIFVDADACPVKDEVYRVAARYGLAVFVVSNSPIAVPRAPEIERVVVGAGPDAADNWIAERAGPSAIVVTSDIPLASRCVKSGADAGRGCRAALSGGTASEVCELAAALQHKNCAGPIGLNSNLPIAMQIYQP